LRIKPLILLVTLVLTSFVLVGVTISEFPPELPGTYSPWGDLNDDGVINIFDIVWLTGRYKETGTPVNKTALLYNVSDTFTEILSQIDYLNNELQNRTTNLETQIASMNMTIAELQSEIEVLGNTKIGEKLWDSDWRSLAIGENIFNFGGPLSTYDNTLVYMVGRKTFTGVLHQIDYGGYAHGLYYYGAYWYDLTLNDIKVNRHGNDANWNYIRIIIWEILP